MHGVSYFGFNIMNSLFYHQWQYWDISQSALILIWMVLTTLLKYCLFLVPRDSSTQRFSPGIYSHPYPGDIWHCLERVAIDILRGERDNRNVDCTEGTLTTSLWSHISTALKSIAPANLTTQSLQVGPLKTDSPDLSPHLLVWTTSQKGGIRENRKDWQNRNRE